MQRTVFLTGGTGYLGSRLIPALLARGHRVRALVRPKSSGRLPAGCEAVVGDALDAASYADRVAPADTFVHLVGTPHPAPWKAAEFERVDFASVRAAAEAARAAGVEHFVYLSVAHPAPAMRAYWRVRAEGERLLAREAFPSTFVRPWYVLGPGHRWAYLAIPLYLLAEGIPATRATARRLGLVTLPQMIDTLAWAVDHPAKKLRAIGVPEIRAGNAAAARDGLEVLLPASERA
ncbi:MAG TPA: NAD(P)H-binding protein [Thermoanaerobaculia bacterium]|nr:NAD(P)H-binding protein [Thermoanaerobaculia bacterium]